MINRYRLFRRKKGVYYLHDSQTGKQFSLKTRTESEAEELLHARNSAARQPILNMEIAKAYLVGRVWTSYGQKRLKYSVNEGGVRFARAVEPIFRPR